jgi:predicted methyltransferase MtxX (methanogen marker protein 4)
VKVQPLRRQDGGVRTDACAQNYMRQAREEARKAVKKVHVELQWGDAKDLSELLTTLLDDGKVDLVAPRGHVGDRVRLIERLRIAIACSEPVVKKTARKPVDRP